jgi:hypothetical protein
MASRNKGMPSRLELSPDMRMSLDRLVSEGCSDSSAPLDLAALSEGTLSPEGLRRLVRHVLDCQTCAAALGPLLEELPTSPSGAGAGDRDLPRQHSANGSRREACADE